MSRFSLFRTSFLIVTEKNPESKLCHMHMHDAKGKSNHLPLGTGELDLPEYFYLAKTQNCRVVLETKTVVGPKESVEWIKSKGR